LARVYLHEGIMILGKGAFRECQSLRRVEIPSTLAVIPAGAFFQYCRQLKNCFVERGYRTPGNPKSGIRWLCLIGIHQFPLLFTID